jgi:arsenate reductase (thioredoxin)
MSAALFERAAGGRHEARSAGTDPADHVHEHVIEAMNELGIDLSQERPKKLTPEMAEWADVVVTMGCGDECPVIPGKKYLDWNLADPEAMDVAQTRALRDQIQGRVEGLVRDLDERV